IDIKAADTQVKAKSAESKDQGAYAERGMKSNNKK
ncbi:unnamed protein product, partial [marine sediment metagenome]